MDFVMNLLMSLPQSYNYFIVTLKSIKIKELKIDYVTIRLNYLMANKKKGYLKWGFITLLKLRQKGAT